jgi:hypothetical protein
MDAVKGQAIFQGNVNVEPDGLLSYIHHNFQKGVEALTVRKGSTVRPRKSNLQRGYRQTCHGEGTTETDRGKVAV